MVGGAPVTQGTAAVASHGHSGVVVTVTVPDPPSAPMLDDGDDSDTWHFAWVGLSDVVVFEPQPAAIAAPKAAISRVSRARNRACA